MPKISLVSAIHDYCAENASPANVLKYSRYFKNGLYDGFGLTASQIYDGASYIIKNQDFTLTSVLDAAPGIIKNGKYEEISIMMLIAKGYHKQFNRETFERISTWYQKGINNWAHADTMGMMVLPLFLKKKIVNVEDFRTWLHADNKFQRRCVPVTFIKLLKTQADFMELFKFTECLMSDPEREVHQGMGWFLREAWKRNHSVTEDFLLQWKDTAPRLIIQYATEKLSKEERIRFRRNSKKQAD